MKTTILRQLIVLPLLIATMAVLHACGSAAGASRASTEAQRFTTTVVLRQGASAPIPQAAPAGVASGSVPVVKLDRVNDSRCRVGAVCVWAGYISYSFTLTGADGGSDSFVLSEGMPNGSKSASRDGLTFTLAGVEPAAVPAKNEPTPDYQVSVQISNTPAP